MVFGIHLVTIHLVTLILTAGCILYADHLGFQYFRGVRERLPHARMHKLHGVVWVGLLGMIASGAAMALPMWEYLVTEPMFMLKMGFVATLVFNALVIGKFLRIASEKSFAELSSRERALFLISGGVSLSCWVGAASVGFLFF